MGGAERSAVGSRDFSISQTVKHFIEILCNPQFDQLIILYLLLSENIYKNWHLSLQTLVGQKLLFSSYFQHLSVKFSLQMGKNSRKQICKFAKKYSTTN
jgi:hypothetical protein